MDRASEGAAAEDHVLNMNLAATLKALPRIPLLRWFERDIAVERYVVCANHEWAIFYIDEKHGAFNCQSTYGTYAYIWRAIGERTLKAFLLDLNFDYFMGKTRPGYHCFDRERSVASVKECILDRRRWGSIDRRTARMAWRDVEANEHENAIRFVDEMTYSEHLMKVLGSEYYDFARELPDVDSKQFWAVIWPEFRKQIGGK